MQKKCVFVIRKASFFRKKILNALDAGFAGTSWHGGGVNLDTGGAPGQIYSKISLNSPDQ